jgi:hypothetical protein
MRLLPQDGQSRVCTWRTCTPEPRQGIGTSLAGFDRVLGAGQVPEAADLMQGITWCLDGRQLASTVADEPLRAASEWSTYSAWLGRGVPAFVYRQSSGGVHDIGSRDISLPLASGQACKCLLSLMGVSFGGRPNRTPRS